MLRPPKGKIKDSTRSFNDKPQKPKEEIVLTSAPGVMTEEQIREVAAKQALETLASQKKEETPPSSTHSSINEEQIREIAKQTLETLAAQKPKEETPTINVSTNISDDQLNRIIQAVVAATKGKSATTFDSSMIRQAVRDEMASFTPSCPPQPVCPPSPVCTPCSTVEVKPVQPACTVSKFNDLKRLFAPYESLSLVWLDVESLKAFIEPANKYLSAQRDHKRAIDKKRRSIEDSGSDDDVIEAARLSSESSKIFGTIKVLGPALEQLERMSGLKQMELLEVANKIKTALKGTKVEGFAEVSPSNWAEVKAACHEGTCIEDSPLIAGVCGSMELFAEKSV